MPAEDALAFFRDDRGFRNVRLVEVDNGDFAQTVVRLLLAATVRLAVLSRLRGSRDPVLAAIAAKGVKELTYHRDWAARWVVTLAQGTAESRARTVAGLARVWPYLDEALRSHPVEQRAAAAGVGVDPAEVARRGRAPCWPRCSTPPGSSEPRVPRGRRGERGAGRTRRLPHRGAGPDAGRDAGGGPRPPDGGVVMTARPGTGAGPRPRPARWRRP